MKHIDIRLLHKPWISILLLELIALSVYFPAFSSEYLYTDEAVQLWHYRPGSDFAMFVEQGRWITNELMSFFFSRAETISDVRYIRILSLAGWLVMIPVWYLLLGNVLRREGFNTSLAFLIVLWLVCSPTVTVSIGWASCFEMFLAYSAGLVSGYLFYLYIMQPANQPRQLRWFPLLSVLCGLLSLFTYQNGIGCFVLPFFIHAIANPGRYAKVFQALFFIALISVVYYLLFRYQMKSLGIPPGERTQAGFNVVRKLRFFFTKPFVSSWLFGYGYNESDRRAILYAIPIFLLVGLGTYRYFTSGKNRVAQLLLPVFLCMVTYFPSLIVKENYSSARTTLALAITVFTWAVLLFSRRKQSDQFGFRGGYLFLVLMFVCNGIFNYNIRFRKPLEAEFLAAKTAFEKGYDASTNSFSFTAPSEDDFEKKYGLVHSWDEFAVPSLFFRWVPEWFFRQLLLEKTGDRQKAAALQVNLVKPAT